MKYTLDGQALKDFAEEVLARVDNTDLKSYSFEKDPDMSFKFNWTIVFQILIYDKLTISLCFRPKLGHQLAREAIVESLLVLGRVVSK